MPTAAIKTLGCKLNQYEGEQIRVHLERIGYVMVEFESGADLSVVNSCTVTAKTDRDARRLARLAKRLNPRAFVVMTGCYAECSPEVLRAIPEVDLVIGGARKLDIARLVPQPDPGPPPPESHDGPCPVTLIDAFTGHTRCFVKVQEGCNASCTYCIIPRARGHSRSVPVHAVLAQARVLGAHGHPELVLIGTHLGQYGADLPVRTGLTELALRLCELTEVQRLRLSSIEPCEVTDSLVALLAGGGRALSAGETARGKVCRHLHIPLQSGCDCVLARMNRPYRTAFYAALLDRIANRQPGTCIGTDIIVGFPGESDTEFDETVAFLESLPLAYIHVFTYSARPGTPAAAMPDQVDPMVRRRRNEVLRALSNRKRTAFASAMVGQRLEVVMQARAGLGRLRGITDNYLELTAAAPEAALHRLVTCTVTDSAGGTLLGHCEP